MKIISNLLAIPLCIAAVLAVLVIVSGIIPVNTGCEQKAGEVKVFVSANSRHTFFILPTRSHFKDWTKVFPPEEFPFEVQEMSGVSYPPYISFGWGDRGYYTEAEDWSELNLEIVLKAALIPTASAMHVEYLKEEPANTENLVPLSLSKDQMQFLVNYISSSVEKTREGQAVIIPEISRYGTDRFYEAKGKYNMFHTSNNWTNEALKEMGIRSPVWSPLEGPIIYQLKKRECFK